MADNVFLYLRLAEKMRSANDFGTGDIDIRHREDRDCLLNTLE